MTTILLDTHVVQWWASQPELLSQAALDAIGSADQLAVASVTWFELAWMAEHNRIELTSSVRFWLDQLARRLDTFTTTPAIAATAAALSRSFPGDPMDRIIYATAVEQGIQVITKDERMRRHPSQRTIAVW